MARKENSSIHTPEFREMAIKLATEGDKSVADVARELGLPVWKLHDWLRKEKRQLVKAHKQTAQLKTTEQRLKELEKRNKQLEQENEILKKAAAYFAKTLL